MIANEIVEKLQVLKGINLDVAFRIFKEKKLDVKASGFAENLVALLIDRELPKNYRGMDFKDLFEVKEIKIHFTQKKGEMKTGGDTSISAYLKSEPNFFESNIWDKTNKILIICVENRIVVDVRYFDGEPYAEQMKQDYEAIKTAKNLCRQNNKILVFKTGYNSISMKGNCALDMSESIIVEEPEITDQDSYIREIFDNKFAPYQEKSKSDLKNISTIMNRLNIADLQKVIEDAQRRINESMGFDLNAGSELTF